MTQIKSGKKKKGIKATMLDLAPTTTAIFPRPSYSSLRTIISTLRIEHPEREFYYSIIEGGIEVVCVK